MDNKSPAILTYVGVWHGSTPPQTGNYVPEGQTASPLISENTVYVLFCERCQSVDVKHRKSQISAMCETTYSYSTSVDTSLYDGIQVRA